ncbi:MAG: LacI family DNA-binding transcriptional regulator [Catenulispora sp.]
MRRCGPGDPPDPGGVLVLAAVHLQRLHPRGDEVKRATIAEIADELGWRPSLAAKSLSGSKAHSVGLVLARPADTLGVEPFFMRFISGLERELSGQRVALQLQVVEDHRVAIGAMRAWWAERRVDGFVVTDLWADDARIPVLDELGVPAVLAGRPLGGPRTGSVWTDDAAAVQSTVDYLVALGHRRIARVAGLPALDHTQVRIAAFRDVMHRHGLTDPVVVETDYTGAEGARATRTLLSRRDRPTAIMFDNDVMAIAALNVAQEMSVAVPGELSIVAGDDSQLCDLVRPALTALSRDIPAYGLSTARVLLDMIDGKPPRSHQEATARLIVRGSTAAAPPA